jgi:hypothetical protein
LSGLICMKSLAEPVDFHELKATKKRLHGGGTAAM